MQLMIFHPNGLEILTAVIEHVIPAAIAFDTLQRTQDLYAVFLAVVLECAGKIIKMADAVHGLRLVKRILVDPGIDGAVVQAVIGIIKALVLRRMGVQDGSE